MEPTCQQGHLKKDHWWQPDAKYALGHCRVCWAARRCPVCGNGSSEDVPLMKWRKMWMHNDCSRKIVDMAKEIERKKMEKKWKS